MRRNILLESINLLQLSLLRRWGPEFRSWTRLRENARRKLAGGEHRLDDRIGGGPRPVRMALPARTQSRKAAPRWRG